MEDSTAQEEREYGLVVSADDPQLLDKVHQGADKGQLENEEEIISCIGLMNGFR